MSTSNNLDQRPLLKYITSCLNNWGITYLSQQHLKQAKKNDHSCRKILQRVLFDLIILHIFDYQYCVDDLGIEFEEQNEMKKIILAHLFQIDCPMLVLNQQNQGQCIISFDFDSSRNILIVCAWIMAISDFFSQITSKLFTKKLTKIYKSKSLNLASPLQKATTSLTRTNMHQECKLIQRISFLSKTLKNRTYTIECLKSKKNKLIKRIKEELKEYSNQITIQDLFSSSNHEEVLKLENMLGEMMMVEKQNMGYRKYWWLWLDIKFIDTEEKILKEQFANYQKLYMPHQNIKFKVHIDLNYPRTYIKTLENLEQQLQNLQKKIQDSCLVIKKQYKQITKEIMQQIKQKSQKGRINQKIYPSFIGMQLKRQMNIDIVQQQSIDPQQYKELVKKSNKNLKENIRSFLRQLDGILLF